VNLSNTSWGPWWALVGDIIIAVAGSTVPHVLHPVFNTNTASQNGFAPTTSLEQPARYLLVSSCVLIDAQLRTLGLAEKPSDRPGFARIIFGSAWDGVFRDGVLKEGKLEEFWLV
jgi:hypothetical protein